MTVEIWDTSALIVAARHQEARREFAAALADSVRLVDLIVAAVAERVGYSVVHVDEDYERIARITGQLTRPLPWAA